MSVPEKDPTRRGRIPTGKRKKRRLYVGELDASSEPLTPEEVDARYRQLYESLSNSATNHDYLVLGRFVDRNGKTVSGLHAPFGCSFVFERWPHFGGTEADIEAFNEIEREKRRVAFGTAFLNLWPEDRELTLANLRREFWRILEDPPTVASEINDHAYARARHSRKAMEDQSKREKRWRDQLEQGGARAFESWVEKHRQKLFQQLAPDLPPGTEASAIASLEDERLGDWIEKTLTQAERETLELILNRAPVEGEADKKRRLRVKAKLRPLLPA
jgi:hypothetical protein